jgi:hypothetical protein
MLRCFAMLMARSMLAVGLGSRHHQLVAKLMYTALFVVSASGGNLDSLSVSQSYLPLDVCQEYAATHNSVLGFPQPQKDLIPAAAVVAHP